MTNITLTGRESLGIEFGSTRIKAVLVDSHCTPIASGDYTWENQLVDGIWTYSMEDAWIGLQSAYASLNEDCVARFGCGITRLASIGFSGMMHGYLPFDKNDNLLCPFRTWRNTITGEAAGKLTELFGFNIPQRWSIAHLYQAILNGESHVGNIAFVTTLAGYIHWQLTGNKVLGVGEASGMFPIDSNTNDYDRTMLTAFANLDEVKQYDWNITDILPRVLVAGENAGTLTESGAKKLDPTGNLEAGAILCPPEGDAGTGMTATNSIAPRTGNVSAGTSIFSMIVLEKQLSKVYEEIDIVTTPTGKPVAMVHCNNCCTELDYWVRMFHQLLQKAGADITKPQLYDLLYQSALDGASNCGGLLSFNYFSGEPVSHVDDGRPMFVRAQGAAFDLPNFMRCQIYSTMATLCIGMEILEKENVVINRLMGHGGLFKTPVVGQRLMAGAMKTPVSVMTTAGEGGAWGSAILARYAIDGGDMTLDEYLDRKVFANCKKTTINPNPDDSRGFEEYLTKYKAALDVQRAAGKCI
ncbi:MAG: xylulokinase [Eubacterium sp.]